MDESRQRNSMVSDVWVNQSSDRFTKQSQEPPVFALKVSTGGTTNSQRGSIRLGDLSVKGNFGSSEAVVTVGLIDIVHNVQIAGFVSRSTRKSVNINQIRLTKSFHGFSTDDMINWQTWDDNPDYRREILAILQVMEDVRAGLARWVSPKIER